MGAGVHKCSSTKTRHMPQAGGSSTNNCQFLGSFKCLSEITSFIFHRKTHRFWNKKHPNLSPFMPSPRKWGHLLAQLAVVLSFSAGRRMRLAWPNRGIIPCRHAGRRVFAPWKVAPFLSPWCFFHVFSFAEERIPWPGIDHEGTSGHCTRGIMNQPYTSWWYPVTSVHQFNLHVRFTCIRFICKINSLEITGP